MQQIFCNISEAETDQHKGFSKLNRRRSNAQAVSPTNAGNLFIIYYYKCNIN